MSFISWINTQYEEKGPLKWFAFLCELVGACVLFGLMMVTCIDVAGRYVFNSPLVGATELTELGLAVLVFSAMPVVTWRGMQIVVDLLDHYLNSTLLKALSLFAALVMSTSLYFLAWRIFEMGERSMRRGIVTDFLGIPRGLVIEYIAIMSWATIVGMMTFGIYRIVCQRNAT